MRPFIPDKEIVLTKDTDLLGTKVYSDNLVRVIENAPKDEVFSIGLFGGWGTGKSSIIKSAEKELKKKTNENIKFITYDSWKYSNDSFRRMFLLRIQEELRLLQCEEMKRFYQTETVESKPKVTFNRKGAIIAISVLLLLLILLQFSSLSIEKKLPLTAIGTLGSFLIALFSGCFSELKLTINKPILFAPEQFEDCFKQMMSVCFKKRNRFEKALSNIKGYVTAGEHSVKDLDKLVIVIDNIDRCPSDTAYQLLADIKTFFCDEKYNIVFVVPVDEKALKTHLFRKGNHDGDTDTNIEQEEFLRKIFNVVLRIKTHQETELQFFANELNSRYQLGYSQDTLAITSKAFVDNPRKIIQLLNNLDNELALYDDDFAEKYEATICAALILHEEFPSFYDKAVKNVLLVNEYITKNEEARNEQLNAFLRISAGAFINTSSEVLQKIFTNTEEILDDLPIEVQKAIRSFDTEKTIQYSKSATIKHSTLNAYLLNRLKSEEQYNAPTQMSQWVHYIVALYDAGVVVPSNFSDIDGCLSGHYNSAIPYSKDAAALCRFASALKRRGYRELSDDLFHYLNLKETKSNDNYHQVAQNVFTHLLSDKDIEGATDLVQNYYFENPIQNEVSFTEKQINIFFDDVFINKLLKDWTDLKAPIVLNNLNWVLAKSPKQTTTSVTSILNKLLALFGSTRGKTCTAFISFIESVIPCLENINRDANNKGSVESLYNTMVSPRGIPRQGYQNNPGYDKKISILDQVDDKQADVIIVFSFEILRISDGRVDVSDTLSRLFSRCSELIYEEAAKAIDENVPLKVIAHVLVQSEQYESDTVLKVIKHLLTTKCDNDYLLNDGLMRSKIDSLLLHTNNEAVVSLIIDLMGDERTKPMVIERIVAKGLINTIPVSFSQHLITSFSRGTADVYQNNTDFLSLVASKGKTEQKKEVVRLMRKELINETNYDRVVDVLSHLEMKDKSVLTLLVEDLKTASSSTAATEEQKEQMIRLIEKFTL